MSDVLAGLSRKDAEALVASFARSGATLHQDGLARIVAHPDAMEIYMALAALGAKVVGAKEMFVDVRADGGLVGELWADRDHGPCRSVLVLEADHE